jgi:hypothetical protein
LGVVGVKTGEGQSTKLNEQSTMSKIIRELEVNVEGT